MPIQLLQHQRHHQNGLQQEVVVVMVPFPAQGHLNQLLHLSRLITSYDIPVHYVGTTTHNHQAKLRVHGWDPLADDGAKKIRFHDLQIPPFLCPPPDPNATNKFPSHLQPVFNASSHLRDPVGKLLHTLSCQARKVIVIYDSLMGSVIQDVSLIPNGESYTFHSVSAFTYFLYILEGLGKPEEANSIIPKDIEIPSLEGCFTNDFLCFIASQYEYHKLNHGCLYNTCKIIEGPYLDLLAMGTPNKKHWGLGPFNPVMTADDDDDQKKINLGSNGRHFCLDWLDKQAPNSVIYVSFGTTTAMSNEQIKEIAIGLKQSNQKFIWVLREADRGDVFNGDDQVMMMIRKRIDDQLPKGYEDSVREMGLVVRDWAPQLEILAHKATGGFVSHCGWNSCVESISMGVPIGAWPMHSDQPRNTVLITKLLKIGFVIKDWERRDEIVKASFVENSVRRLMDSKEGDEVRKRAAELGLQVKRAAGEGGVSRIEMDSFIAHIKR